MCNKLLFTGGKGGMTEEVNGDEYWFIDEEQMIKDIASNKFVEHGIHDDNYYGTTFEEIRRCIRSGRMCILDISPQVNTFSVYMLAL